MKKVIAIGMILLIVITALCSCGTKQAPTIIDVGKKVDSLVKRYELKWATKAVITSEGLVKEKERYYDYAYSYEIEIMLKQEMDSYQIENMVDDLNDKLVEAFYGYEITTIIIVFNKYGNVILRYLNGEIVYWDVR